jgi:arabinogalactan oligomer/maltooligosaccharide transport system substrate-binding protein
LTRKVLSFLVVVAALACKGGGTPAGGPGGPAAERGEAAGPVEIVLWHSYREGEKAALEKTVEAFHASNPGIRVRLLNVPYDAFIDKVTIATPRGQGPDLFVFAHNMIGEWVDHVHLLEPISDRVGRDVLKRFVPSTVRALVYRQSLYGLPLAFKSVALFYDTDLVTVPPDTAERLVQVARAATDKAAGRYGLAFEAGLLYFDAAFIHGFGGEILDPAGTPRVSGKGVAEALAWLRGLVREGLVPSGMNSAMVTSMFNEGKAAMVVSGPWFSTEVAKDRRFAVAMLPAMPGGTRAKPFLGSEAIFLSAFSRHKDAALKVALALTSDEAALVRLKTGRQTVANEAVWQREDVSRDVVLSAFRQQADNSVLMPSRPEMQAVWSTMDMAINQAVFGEVEPAKALADAQAKIEADIGKMAK